MAPKGAMVPVAQSYCVFRQMSKILSVFTSAIKDLWCALAWCSTALHVKFWPTNELADSDDFEKKEGLQQEGFTPPFPFGNIMHSLLFS